NPLPAAGDQFGFAVATAGSRLLIGAPGDHDGAGAVFLFAFNTGELIRTFTKPTPRAGDRFGASIAVTQAGVLVGAPSDGVPAAGVGRERSAASTARRAASWPPSKAPPRATRASGSRSRHSATTSSPVLPSWRPPGAATSVPYTASPGRPSPAPSSIRHPSAAISSASRSPRWAPMSWSGSPSPARGTPAWP